MVVVVVDVFFPIFQGGPFFTVYSKCMVSMVNLPLKFTHVSLATLTKIPPHTAPSTDENGMLSSHLMRKFEENQLKALPDFWDGSWTLFPGCI